MFKKIFTKLGKRADRLDDGIENINYTSDHSERKRLNRLTKFLSQKKIYTSLYITAVISVIAVIYYMLYKLSSMSIKSYIETRNLFPKKILFIEPLYNFWFVFIFILIIAVFFYIKLSYHIKISFSDLNVGQKGTSRWTTREEIKEQYKKIPENHTDFPGMGGIPVARENNEIYIDDSNTNTMIIGTTRSGKDEIINNPLIDNISRAEIKSSFIATDPKLEYAHKQIPKLMERGYRCNILNLIDPEYSCGFNPLKLIIDEFDKGYKKGNLSVAQDLAMSTAYVLFPPIVNDHNPFFTNTARDLFVATLFAMAEDAYKQDEIYNITERANHIKRQKENIEKKLKNHYKENYNNYLIKTLAIKVAPEVYVDLINKNNDYESLLDELKQVSKEKEIGIDFSNITAKDLKNILFNLKINHQKIETNEYEEKKYSKDKINIYSLITFVSRLSAENKLDAYFLNREETSFARLKYSSIQSSSEKTTGEIVASFFEKTSSFLTQDLAKITSFSSIDIKDIGFGEKPEAIFIGIPDQDSSKDFLATLFVTQVNFVLSRLATATQKGKLRRRTYFILNEFVSLPKFENIAKNVRVGLGREILHVFTIQDLASLHNLYQEDATSILSNCGNLIFLKAGDNDTNKEISELIDGRSLITATQLRELKKGEMIVLRTMKRDNLKGESITPTPIANLGKNRMKYRYEFLEDTFPSSQKIYESPRAKDIGENIEVIKNIKMHTTTGINLSTRTFTAGNVLYRISKLSTEPLFKDRLTINEMAIVEKAISLRKNMQINCMYKVLVSEQNEYGEIKTTEKLAYNRINLEQIAFSLMENTKSLMQIKYGIAVYNIVHKKEYYTA